MWSEGPAPFYEAYVRSAPVVTGILLRVPWNGNARLRVRNDPERKEAQTAWLLRVSGC